MKVEVEIKTIYDPNGEEKFLQMTMGEANFTDKETGEKRGCIHNVLPIGLQILSERSGKQYSVDLKSLFGAVMEAEEEGMK